LESVLKNAGGKFFEIIVVDNASTDKTAEVAARYPGVRVVHEPQKGLPSARECGRLAATGEFLAYIDADTRMPPGWLDTVVTFFAAHPEAVALSGPASYWDATRWQKFLLFLTWWVSAPLMYRLVGYMIYGAHFVARRDALERAGGFNRTITFYGEDTDIARRLSKYGKYFGAALPKRRRI
jgi:glycosyltransferase involved in cell wall biosynthesis